MILDFLNCFCVLWMMACAVIDWRAGRPYWAVFCVLVAIYNLVVLLIGLNYSRKASGI